MDVSEAAKKFKVESAKAGAKKGKNKGKKKDHEHFSVEEEETALNKTARDRSVSQLCYRPDTDSSARIATEAQNGMIAQVIKDRLFNTPLSGALDAESARRATQGVL